MAGRLEVITGPMFSGKTEELLRRLRRAEIAGRSVILLRPEIDDRYDLENVVSHNGVRMGASSITVAKQLVLYKDYDLIGLDEAQFLDGIADFINVMLWAGRSIIVAGLDMTYRAEPFGDMPELMSIADTVDKLTAVCNKCGNDAAMTYRKSSDKETIHVGGLEDYEARCRECFGQES